MATKPTTKASAKKKVILEDEDSDNSMDVDEHQDASEIEDLRPSTSKLDLIQPAKKKKTASETYTKVWCYVLHKPISHLPPKLSQLEHILKRPDSYIGSVETITQTMWTFDVDTKRMVHRDVKYVPGFFKIVDEILVNAADNKVRVLMRNPFTPTYKNFERSMTLLWTP